MGFEADANGLNVWYGPRKVASEIQGVAGKDVTGGVLRQLVIDFSYDALPAADADNNANQVIPAGSYIESAHLEVLVAFAGGTSYDIGTERTDGTDIDVDGIDNDIALADMDEVGDRVKSDGALIGTESSNDYDSQIVVTATGTYTAGKARLVVNYVPPSV
jgi:hypothetical protein